MKFSEMIHTTYSAQALTRAAGTQWASVVVSLPCMLKHLLHCQNQALFFPFTQDSRQLRLLPTAPLDILRNNEWEEKWRLFHLKEGLWSPLKPVLDRRKTKVSLRKLSYDSTEKCLPRSRFSHLLFVKAPGELWVEHVWPAACTTTTSTKSCSYCWPEEEPQTKIPSNWNV